MIKKQKINEQCSISTEDFLTSNELLSKKKDSANRKPVRNIKKPNNEQSSTPFRQMPTTSYFDSQKNADFCQSAFIRITRSKSRSVEAINNPGIIAPIKRKMKCGASTQKNKKRKIDEFHSILMEELLTESVDEQRSIQTEKSSIGSTAANEVVPTVKTVATTEFVVGNIVWAEIRGSPHWPAEILSFPSNRMVDVVWFNDYRKTRVYRTQIFNFLRNFDEYCKKSEDFIGLKTAVMEAMICYSQKNHV